MLKKKINHMCNINLCIVKIKNKISKFFLNLIFDFKTNND